MLIDLKSDERQKIVEKQSTIFDSTRLDIQGIVVDVLSRSKLK